MEGYVHDRQIQKHQQAGESSAVGIGELWADVYGEGIWAWADGSHDEERSYCDWVSALRRKSQGAVRRTEHLPVLRLSLPVRTHSLAGSSSVANVSKSKSLSGSESESRPPGSDPDFDANIRLQAILLLSLPQNATNLPEPR